MHNKLILIVFQHKNTKMHLITSSVLILLAFSSIAFAILLNPVSNRCIHIGRDAHEKLLTYAKYCTFNNVSVGKKNSANPHQFLEIVSTSNSLKQIQKPLENSLSCLIYGHNNSISAGPCSSVNSTFNFQPNSNETFSIRPEENDGSLGGGKCLTIHFGSEEIKLEECQNNSLLQRWVVCRHSAHQCDVEVEWSPAKILFKDDTGHEEIQTENVVINDLLYFLNGSWTKQERNQLGMKIRDFYTSDEILEALGIMRGVAGVGNVEPRVGVESGDAVKELLILFEAIDKENGVRFLSGNLDRVPPSQCGEKMGREFVKEFGNLYEKMGDLMKILEEKEIQERNENGDDEELEIIDVRLTPKGKGRH